MKAGEVSADQALAVRPHAGLNPAERAHAVLALALLALALQIPEARRHVVPAPVERAHAGQAHAGREQKDHDAQPIARLVAAKIERSFQRLGLNAIAG